MARTAESAIDACTGAIGVLLLAITACSRLQPAPTQAVLASYSPAVARESRTLAEAENVADAGGWRHHTTNTTCASFPSVARPLEGTHHFQVAIRPDREQPGTTTA